MTSSPYRLPLGLPRITRSDEGSALAGVCAGIAKSLLWFCNAVVRWSTPSAELNGMFHALLNGFKASDPTAWAASVATFPPVIQERLAQRYGV